MESCGEAMNISVYSDLGICDVFDTSYNQEIENEMKDVDSLFGSENYSFISQEEQLPFAIESDEYVQ